MAVACAVATRAAVCVVPTAVVAPSASAFFPFAQASAAAVDSAVGLAAAHLVCAANAVAAPAVGWSRTAVAAIAAVASAAVAATAAFVAAVPTAVAAAASVAAAEDSNTAVARLGAHHAHGTGPYILELLQRKRSDAPNSRKSH